MALKWTEIEWNEVDPPPWVGQVFDAMLRAQRIAENRCPKCGEGPLDHCRTDGDTDG